MKYLLLAAALVFTAATTAAVPPACTYCEKCRCKPGDCPGKCTVVVEKTAPTDAITVEVEDVEGGQRMTYIHDANTTYIWTVTGKATPELAAALVRDVYCRTGRCPLKMPKVTLKTKKKFD